MSNSFLQRKKKKKAPNVTSLLTANLPRGRGRKGGVAPRVRKARKEPAARIEMSIPTTSSSVIVSQVQSKGDFCFSPSMSSSRDNVSQFSPPDWGLGYSSFSSPYLTSNPPYHTPLSPYHTQTICPPYHTPTIPHYNYPPTPQFTSMPAPTAQYQPADPFVLCFITGNISSCFGCKNKYTRPLQPPEDLCIKHKDWREFMSPNGNSQAKFGNVYYHCKPECVRFNYPFFLQWIYKFLVKLARSLLMSIRTT